MVRTWPPRTINSPREVDAHQHLSWPARFAQRRSTQEPDSGGKDTSKSEHAPTMKATLASHGDPHLDFRMSIEILLVKSSRVANYFKLKIISFCRQLAASRHSLQAASPSRFSLTRSMLGEQGISACGTKLPTWSVRLCGEFRRVTGPFSRTGTGKPGHPLHK